MRYRRPWYHKSVMYLAPGALVVLFALAAIALPVGSDGLGAGATGGVTRWARDIHDGFWQAAPRYLMLGMVSGDPDHLLARSLCRRGEAEQAVALYKRIGVTSLADHEALYQLSERLVVDANYDRCEWYARAADELLHGNILRNNLAWHYTQADIRQQQALDLALASVADGRDACNVDTLAWAYFRDGQPEVAASVARETLAFGDGSPDPYDGPRAKESSRRLLGLMGRRP